MRPATRKGAQVAEAAEGAANGADAAAPLLVASPLSILLSRHMFQEGEIIELAVRPSSLWIIFASWRTLLIACIAIVAGFALPDYLKGRANWCVEAGLLLAAGRLMWATIRWMSRLYVLTNMRLMTISGVFNVSVTECPLRRLGRVMQCTPVWERFFLLGTLHVIPMDDSFAVQYWQTIAHPGEVERKIRAAAEKLSGGSRGQSI